MIQLIDMLVRIKNAGNAGKETVIVSHSKFKFTVAQLLLREGYISALNKKGKGIKKNIEIIIAYEKGRPKIGGLEYMSMASRRMYVGVRNIKRVHQGHGETILSTPKGILTGREARKEGVGGETLFKIW